MATPKSPPFTDPTALQLDQTLARQLIPTADSLRDILTQFGLRPYKVRLIQVRWSGGSRGIGTPTLADQPVDILPTPKMIDLNTLQEIVTPGGLDEVGSILLTQISGQFTEEDLLGNDEFGNGPDADIEFFYEIEFIRPDGLPGDLRRFVPRSAPQYYAGKFQWQIRLERSHEDRARDGTPDP